eukprot:3230809-Rhodomonas_salina.2
MPGIASETASVSMARSPLFVKRTLPRRPLDSDNLPLPVFKLGAVSESTTTRAKLAVHECQLAPFACRNAPV